MSLVPKTQDNGGSLDPYAGLSGSGAHQYVPGQNKLGVFDSHDDHQEHAVIDPASNDDPTHGRFTHYATMGMTRFVYATMARTTVTKFLGLLSPTAATMALASVEVDISGIPIGTSLTVQWRGKPVFIRHRTDAEINASTKDDAVDMRDPATDSDRCSDPRYMIVIGICTHLGCIPVSGAGSFGGWYCPCHGSHYDLAGRIRKGPAPLNLDVPEYTFLSDKILKLG
jgi:ubiquinol-cytochrome c reductase iron-sulfur subunit